MVLTCHCQLVSVAGCQAPVALPYPAAVWPDLLSSVADLDPACDLASDLDPEDVVGDVAVVVVQVGVDLA